MNSLQEKLQKIILMDYKIVFIKFYLLLNMQKNLKIYSIWKQ